MKFDIVSIFPDSFQSYFASSIIGRAVRKKLIKINLLDLRDFAKDRRKTVDDKPFGGGPGMILKIEPIYKAVSALKSKLKVKTQKFGTRTILLSAKGKLFTQKHARRLAKYNQLILICGHYEGVDERVAKHVVDEELSIGEFVLTSGELGAAVIVDAVSRLVPGVLGKSESLKEESFSLPGYLEYPQYTRPEVFRLKAKNFRPKLKKKSKKPKIEQIANNRLLATVWRAPKILLSGNHEKIQEWRKKHSGLR